MPPMPPVATSMIESLSSMLTVISLFSALKGKGSGSGTENRLTLA